MSRRKPGGILASSLLLKALLDGYLGLTQGMQDLLDDLLRSIADRTTKNLMNRLSRLDVLLADEMGYPQKMHVKCIKRRLEPPLKDEIHVFERGNSRHDSSLV